MLKELNLSWLIRYGYSGMLLYLMLVIAYPAKVKVYTDAAGPVLAPLVVLTAGACIYVFYRHIVGEWVLFPLAHLVDYGGNRRNGQEASSMICHLYKLGVPANNLRQAYTALRREFLLPDIKKQLDLAHSEVFVLYISVAELGALGCVLWWQHANGFPLVLAAAGLILVSALAADVRQHRSEYRTMMIGGSEPYIDFLKKLGYLQERSRTALT